MPARASFSFEDGILISSWYATLPLRMRVSMSAIGSVIVIASPSPTGLRHARHLAGVDHLAVADAAESDLAVHGTRPAAPAAPRVAAHLELRLALLLLNKCLLRHYCAPSRRKGN